jgi:hypothetical protein
MSFGSYSTTPASNTSINGINIAPNCAAGNVDNAIRQIMADGRELYDTVDAIDVSSKMEITGGYFYGDIVRAQAGGYWYHAHSAMTGGLVYTQAVAAALPSSPAEGTVVLQY